MDEYFLLFHEREVIFFTTVCLVCVYLCASLSVHLSIYLWKTFLLNGWTDFDAYFIFAYCTKLYLFSRGKSGCFDSWMPTLKLYHVFLSSILTPCFLFRVLQTEFPSLFLKSLISVSTIILLGLILAYHALEVQVNTNFIIYPIFIVLKSCHFIGFL